MVTLTQKRARNSVFFSFPFLNEIIPSPASPLTAVLEAKEIPNSSWDSTFLSIQIKLGRWMLIPSVYWRNPLSKLRRAVRLWEFAVEKRETEIWKDV